MGRKPRPIASTNQFHPVGFRIVPLEARTAAQAYPLLRNHWPDLSLGAWLRFARALCRSRSGARASGLDAVLDPAGYIYGLVGYEFGYDMVEGRVMRIDLLVALGLVNTDVLVLLLDSVERAAARENCEAVILAANAMGAGRWRVGPRHEALARAGFEPATGALVRHRL